ncbi:MAG: PQQ-dependent sugar dehydrogenase [Dehalococcoidia bacterium]
MVRIKLISACSVLLTLLIVLQGCADTATPSPPPATPTVGPTPTPTPNTTIEVLAEVVVKELKVPWALAFAPDGRLFVTEREGIIRVIRDGQVQTLPYAEVEVAQEGEGGLLGLALDPNFESNGYLYVYHTYSSPRGPLLNKVVRLEDRGEKAENPAVILDDIPGSRFHNGGRIKFGPDGKLYIATGDAASNTLAQDLTSLAGKILRINKDGSIPQDNPFPDSPVYSYGHRNPQGLAWHPVTGQLYATEHGPVGHDEVNRIVAGSNYGWPIIIGAGNDRRFQDPVLESGIDTWAPSGAAFYDGDLLPPEWKGRLVFGALRGRRIIWITLRPPEYRAVQDRGSLFGQQFGRIRDVVQGPDGYLYFATNNRDGRGTPGEGDDLILRIVPVRGSLSYLPQSQVDRG